MARDPQSLHIPLRTASANVDHNDSQENLRSEKANNRTSKAQKVLGTAEISIQQNTSPRDDASSHKRRTRRPSFMKGGGLVPFPTINNDNGMAQQNQPQLRVRASSPLLLNTQEASAASSNPKKTVHQSGSSSTLFSYFNSRDSTTTVGSPSELKPGAPSISLSSKNSTKESKRKLRPPRIDLSLLFPKPKPEKPAGAPMLSPQRMVHSPSPLSAVGEFPKSNNPHTRPSGRRYTETKSQTESPTVAEPPSPAIPRPGSHRSAPANRSSAISTDTRNTEFLEPSLQRTVRTSEMDMALQNYSEHQQQEQQQAAMERAQSDAASSVYSRTRDQLHSNRSRVPDKGPRRVSSNSSMGGWSKETYLSPKSQPPRPPRQRPSPSRDQWPVPPPPLRETDSSSMSKKSSKSTLANSDLNVSSVLCLSSSEDEDDDHDEGLANNRTGASHLMRDSVTTYGEFEPEICTASAAQATRGPAVRRLDLRQAAAVKHRGPTMLMSPSIHRNGSMSTARSSYIGRRAPSAIPTISEPDISDHFPAPGGNGRASAASRERAHRRSRVIAVTRQEESLLEAMRLRRGKVTPSLFNEARFSQNTITTHRSNPNLNVHNHNDNNSHAIDTDKESMLSAPSRDSLYSTDMSFLRLSASIPSYTTATTATDDNTHNTNNHSRSDQGAAHLDRDSPPSQGAASDAEQKTLNSPRASLVYSESLPSPATSGASPLTPTLPIHRFSPLPSRTQHSPPSRALPTSAPSNDQRRHSRRRTDSSEAIVLGEATEPTAKENDEFPIWALGWNHDLAAVH